MAPTEVRKSACPLDCPDACSLDVTVEDGRFPQDIKLECVKEKVRLLEGVEPGQRVTVTFDIRRCLDGQLWLRQSKRGAGCRIRRR